MAAKRELQNRNPETSTTHMYFLARDKIYETTKPYSMRYQPEDGTPQTNLVREKHDVQVSSMRDGGDFKLNVCGFQVMKIESKMSYEDYWDPVQIESVYLPEVKKALKECLGARHVHVLDYVVRKRHKSFPISTGNNYEYDQPTAMCHIDFTVREGERIIRLLYGDRAAEVLRAHWQIVKSPIKGPLNDWPLALCDARSVDFENDVEPGDIVFNDFFTENIQIRYNLNHRWYYLPDQEVSEALIFKSADSEECMAPASPHAGFYNPKADPDLRRESLDCRCFVFFADLEEFPRGVVDSIKGDS